MKPLVLSALTLVVTVCLFSISLLQQMVLQRWNKIFYRDAPIQFLLSVVIFLASLILSVLGFCPPADTISFRLGRSKYLGCMKFGLRYGGGRLRVD